MKAEPLKNKIKLCRYSGFATTENAFKPKDIKSAIDWYLKYKDNMKLYKTDYPEEYFDYFNNSTEEYYNYILNKAFEDVMKK